MGRKNKLRKFNQVLQYPNVVENYNAKDPKLVLGPDQEIELKGQWVQKYYENNNPLVVELACGRGEYTVQLGRKYPEKNFLGVDIKGARIWQGATIALEESLSNVRFLRTRIEQIELFFESGEINEIWITFPDPFLAKPNRRLTSPRFLDRYRNIMSKDNLLHLKTDDDTLYEYTLEVLEEREDVEVLYHDNDIYSKTSLYLPELAFKTYYEGQHLSKGKTIKYIQFSLKDI